MIDYGAELSFYHYSRCSVFSYAQWLFDCYLHR